MVSLPARSRRIIERISTTANAGEPMNATEIWIAGQAKCVEESAEAWKRDEASIRDVHFVELLIRHHVEIGSSLDEMVRSAWREYQQAPTTYPAQKRGETLAELLEAMLRVFDRIEECVSSSESAGFQVDGAEDFRAAHRALASLNERFLDGWPMLDMKAAEEARADIEAGRFFDLEDIARAMDHPV